MPRRFPPPWSIEESSACFIVRDGDKQALAYVYFESEPGRRSSARLLTRDDAFLIAVNIAKLPSVPRQILKDIPRPPHSASRDDCTRASRAAALPPCVDGSELARTFFTFAALVGAPMCTAFKCGSHDRWP